MAERERRAQKDRTREAILAGARELLFEGKPVTVTAAAAQVGISKATAYRYFRDPAALAVESGLAIRVAPLEEILDGAETLREQLLAINLYFFDFAMENEAGFRQFLASSVTAALANPPQKVARRGARRIEMYKSVLQAEGHNTDDPRAIRFCAALATATGIEAMIALVDIAGLEPREARLVVKEMTNALIDNFMKPTGSE